MRHDLALNSPLLETPTHWCTHGFDSLPLSTSPPSTAAEVGFPPLGDLNAAGLEATASEVRRAGGEARSLAVDLRRPADCAALVDLYGKVRSGSRVRNDETNPLVGVLRLSGIYFALATLAYPLILQLLFTYWGYQEALIPAHPESPFLPAI